jgi:hypothetical protein
MSEKAKKEQIIINENEVFLRRENESNCFILRTKEKVLKMGKSCE